MSCKITLDGRFLAVPGMIEAESHSKGPSRKLSSEAPDSNRLACLGIKENDPGAQHGIDLLGQAPSWCLMSCKAYKYMH